jgi:hypothetical protein
MSSVLGVINVASGKQGCVLVGQGNRSVVVVMLEMNGILEGQNTSVNGKDSAVTCEALWAVMLLSVSGK